MYTHCANIHDFAVFIYTKGVTILQVYTAIIPGKYLKLSSENFPFVGNLWQNKCGVWVTVSHPTLNVTPTVALPPRHQQLCVPHKMKSIL
jgi:hypothetical protein